MAGGNFQGYTTAAGAPVTIYDPATGDANGLGRTPFPNNTIPADQNRARSSTALLKYLGTSDQPPTTLQRDRWSRNYSYSTSSPQDRQSLTVRGDYYQSAAIAVGFSLQLRERKPPIHGSAGSGQQDRYELLPVHGFQHLDPYARTSSTKRGLATLTSTIRPVCCRRSRTDVVDRPQDIPGLNGGCSFNLGYPEHCPSVQDLRVRHKSIWSGFGDRGGDGPYVVTDPTWQIVDNVSWIRGKHSLRLGFEYNRQTFNQLGNQFSRGQFSSQPLATALESGTPGNVTLSQGDALADFLLGDLYQSTVAVAVANANYVRNVQAYYVDDTYKLLPNLTISAGLRYELTPPWNDTFGNNFNVAIPVYAGRWVHTSTTIPAEPMALLCPAGQLRPCRCVSGPFDPMDRHP